MDQAWARRAVPNGFAWLTLLSVGVLLVCDAIPRLFPARAHDYCAALPLAWIALALVVHQAVRHASAKEWAKTILIAVAFLFWAANQLCRDRVWAALLNDIAITAFVFDALLVIFAWPPDSTQGDGKASDEAKSDLSVVTTEPLARTPERAINV
jgi:hypothetical protein